MEDVTKILVDLVNTINEYDAKFATNRLEEEAPIELKAYWKAKDIAEEYIKNIS